MNYQIYYYGSQIPLSEPIAEEAVIRRVESMLKFPSSGHFETQISKKDEQGEFHIGVVNKDHATGADDSETDYQFTLRPVPTTLQV